VKETDEHKMSVQDFLNITDIDDTERDQIKLLRETCKADLSKHFDTDYNVRRFLHGGHNDMAASEQLLRRHLLVGLAREDRFDTNS
jgi:hypothetical protein